MESKNSMIGETIDDGYVVFCPERNEYITSNRGLFVTERNARKLCEKQIRLSRKYHCVLKVNLVVSEVQRPSFTD